MPSEEELRQALAIKRALADERADGWGPQEPLTVEDWANIGCLGGPQLHLQPEKTLLESGQVLSHHAKGNCSGSCCLHGTSLHPSCRMPRVWKHDTEQLEHMCPHGVGHPCYAGIEYSGQPDDGIHHCDGCCVSVDNRPTDLSGLNGYMLYEHQGKLDDLIEENKLHCDEIEELKGRTTALLWIVVIMILGFGLAFLAR